MKTLAIETSCDDTSLSIISYYGDTFNVEQLLAYSQIADHQKYGGVLPEIASRLHSEKIIAILQRIGWETIADVDFISVTTHPGLPGSLVVGKAVAVMLAEYFNKPLVEVNHIHGHIFSILLERKLTDLTFPMVILTASGGHNDIYLVTPLPKGGSGEAAGGFVDGEKKSYKDIIRYD
jgi:N6-L-threonylcarbamoyladenine synthase